MNLNQQQNYEIAVLAGGCFWGVEEIIRQVPGVVGTCVGYTGGTTQNPTYKELCTGKTGHAECIQVTFDNTIINYSDLLRVFFRMHDPTTKNRQHNDIGTQYRSAIFFQNEDHFKIAQQIIAELNESGRFNAPIVTTLESFTVFYSAENEHQEYLQKNPGGYNCHILRP